MFGHSNFEIVRYKVLCNCSMEENCKRTSLDKARKLFVWECFCINQTAHTDCSCENMYLFDFTSFNIGKKLRLVTNPINVDLFARFTIYSHGNIFATVVFLNKSTIVFIKLRFFITIRILFLIFKLAV